MQLANDVISAAALQKLRISTAESCTGGLISALLTDISGASAVFDRGFATYSNDAKCEMLGLSQQLLTQFGAVSAEVAKAMAVKTLEHSNADIAITTTGIAGPTGATENKPIGLVYFGFAAKNDTAIHSRKIFPGNRQQVRHAAVLHALKMVRNYLDAKA